MTHDTAKVKRGGVDHNASARAGHACKAWRRLVVGPENPDQWKYLTFVSAMITLQPCCFPHLLTVRDKDSDHATRRLHPARIDRHMVSLTCVHADRNRRSAPPNRGLQTNDRSAASADQGSFALGVAVATMARLAGCFGVRSAPDRDRLAAATIP